MPGGEKRYGPVRVESLRDQNVRLEMGRAARERVERLFTQERMIREVETVYEDLIGG